MKRFYIYCILAIVAIAGCKKPEEPVNPDKPDTPTPENTVLSVKFAKTVYASDENQTGPSLTWKAGDEIVVNGKTSTDIKINGSDASVAEFAFGEAIDKPYTIAYPVLAEGKFNIPAAQQYKQADFDWAAAAFVGKASDASSVAELKNASAFLKLKITCSEANCSIVSVSIAGNNSEKLNGAFTPNYTAGTINASGNVSESEKCITLSCGSGVAVTSEGTDFYIVLPPVTFTAGYTVTMKDSEAKEISVSISGKTVFAAGKIYTPAAIEFKEQGSVPEPENTVLSVKLAKTVYASDQQEGPSLEWKAGDAITVNGKTSTGIMVDASDAGVAEFAFGEVLTAPFNMTYPVLSGGNFTIPATQQYQEDNFDWSAAVFVGSAADASSVADLKSANSFLKLKITTTETACSIVSVAIAGKNNEKLNGAFAPDYTNKTIIHSGNVAAAEKTATLSSQTGVSVIGTGKDFCIVLPPVNFTNGYVVTLKDSEENERSYEYAAAAFEAGKIYVDEIEYTVAGPGKEKNLSIGINAAAVAITGTGETLTPSWKQFDRLRIYTRQAAEEITGEPAYTLQNQNAASANASFTMSETVRLYDRSTYTIRGFVPSEAYVFNFIPKTDYPVAEYPWSAKAVRVDAMQNPAANGIDSHSDILYMKALTVTPEDISSAAGSNTLNLNAEFVRATAVLKIVFTDNTADKECNGVKFDYVEVEAATNLAGDAVLNLDSGFTGEMYQNPSKKVRATYADGFTVGSDAVLLNVLPGTLNGKVTISGHSRKLDFSKAVSVSSLALEPGKITKIEVSLEDNNIYLNIVGPDEGAAEDLRIMQFNVLYAGCTDYPQAVWDTRKPGIAAMLADTKPDIICMNECQKNNFHYIYDDSDGLVHSHGLLYDTYDCYRQGTESTDDNVIFYKKGYTKLDSNHFDVDTYSPSPRHAVWVKLRSPKGKEFYVVSTHIEARNGAEYDVVRKNSAQTIVTRMKEIAGNNATIFVLGDMNDTLSDDKQGIEPFIGNDGRTGWLQDARMTSPVVVGNYSLNKFGQYAPTDAMNVDMIFYRNITAPEKFTTVTKEYAGVRYISDHYPVMLDCKL